jgi:hypothetical protein
MADVHDCSSGNNLARETGSGGKILGNSREKITSSFLLAVGGITQNYERSNFAWTRTTTTPPAPAINRRGRFQPPAVAMQALADKSAAAGKPQLRAMVASSRHSVHARREAFVP